MKQPFTAEEFKDIYSRVPRLTVEVVVQNEKGVLLTLRKLPSWHNMWHFPGGTVYLKEPLEEAVRRIAREELGVEVEPERLLGYIEYPSEEKERGFGWSVGLAFRCRIVKGEVRGSDQAEEARFFKTPPPDAIPEVKRFLENLSSRP